MKTSTQEGLTVPSQRRSTGSTHRGWLRVKLNVESGKSVCRLEIRPLVAVVESQQCLAQWR